MVGVFVYYVMSIEIFSMHERRPSGVFACTFVGMLPRVVSVYGFVFDKAEIFRVRCLFRFILTMERILFKSPTVGSGVSSVNVCRWI